MFSKGISHRLFLVSTALIITLLYIPVFLLNASPSSGTTTNNSKVSIFSASPNPASSGTYVTLTGANFTLENTIHFSDDNGDIIGEIASSTDRSTLTFQVPDTITSCEDPDDDSTCTDTSFQGTYDISVENENGTSNSIPLTVSAVGSVQGIGMNIISFYPSSGGLGSEITIKGNNFPQGAQCSIIFGDSVFNCGTVSSTTITFRIQAQEIPLVDAQSYNVYAQFSDSNSIITTTNSLPFVFRSNTSVSNNSNQTQTQPQQDLVITTGDRRGPANPIKTDGVKYDNNSEIVTDTTNGLMWAKCVNGISGAGCSESENVQPSRLSYADATSTCRDSNLGGYNGWRLPFIEELQPLMVKMYSDKNFANTYFPNDPQDFLWTKTSYDKKIQGMPVNSRYVVYYDGRPELGLSLSKFYSRCVRNSIPGETAYTGSNASLNNSYSPLSDVETPDNNPDAVNRPPRITTLDPYSYSLRNSNGTFNIIGTGFTQDNQVFVDDTQFVLEGSNQKSYVSSNEGTQINIQTRYCKTFSDSDPHNPSQQSTGCTVGLTVGSHTIQVKNENGQTSKFVLTVTQ